MKLPHRMFLIFIALLLFQKAIAQTTDTTATYQNPVFHHDFPDPNLVQAKDGFFYAYSTQVSWKKEGFGGAYLIPVLRSRDLVHWDTIGAALQKKPAWKSDGGIWAPDAGYYNRHYFLYYSYSTWGDPNPGIGIATAKNPQGPFADRGKLFFSKEIGVPNSIDPFFMVVHRKPYLVWGSFNGIYAVRLSKDGLHVKGQKFQIAGNAFEGSFIYPHNGWYYYFGSTGSCCEGAKSTYQVKAGRSKNFKGPYIDKDGKPLLQNGGTLVVQGNSGVAGFVGPGHNGDIVTDKKGQTWMIYHAFEKQNDSLGRVLLLDKIDWINDWPVMADAQPSQQSHAGPVF